MTETRSILKAVSTVDSKLPTLPLEDGQLIFVYDKKKIILDNHGVRTVYEQIQTIETEEQRNDLLAPIDSFYFVIETSILWRYSNGHWNQITTSPQEQIDRIATEGTKQVKAVRDEGQKVLQSIPEDFQTQMETKLNKQQGIENKGKVLVIGEDGNVAPGEVQSGGGDGIAIINTMSGESPLAIPDSAERVNKRLELGGKTEQVQTTGAQLFEASRYEGVTKNGVTVTVKDGVITATGTPNINTWIQVFVSRENYQKLFKPENKIYLKTNKSKDCNYDFGIYGAFGSPIIGTIRESNSGRALPAELPRNDTDFYFFIDVKIGTELKGSIKPIVYHDGDGTWEPYTGGKPSPSQEYQQEIKNVGKWNEGTQKYEVDVKVTGKNLFDMNKFIDTCNFTKNEDGTFIIDKHVERYDCFIPANTILSIEVLKVEDSSGAAALELFYEDGKSMYIGFGQVGVKTFLIQKDVVYIKVLAYRKHEYKYIQLEKGNTATPYEPYKEQTLTLTSDRPITKWDRLVEQGGEYGWLYGTKKYTVTGSENYIFGGAQYYSGISTNMYINAVKNMSGEGVCRRLKSIIGIWDKSNNTKDGFCINSGNQIHMRFFNNLLGVSDDATMEEKKAAYIAYLKKEYEKGTPYEIVYQSLEPEFVPLPQSEQNAIRALKTYYPTTVITADGGELDPDIKVTYTADTKNYIDNKFGKTINAMQTKLLELESRV